MTTANGKSLAVERLLPIAAEIKDPVRQAHYLQKLARMAGVNERTLEAALSRIRPSPVKRRGEPKPPVTRTLHPLASNPLEADCLALLLQHPELKDSNEKLLPEYFTNSETREIFVSWQQVEDLSSLRENIDLSLLEIIDTLIDKNLPSNNVDRRYGDYTRRLRERFLKNRAAKISEILALEAESADIDTDRAILEEEGVEISTQLRELDIRKNQKRSEMRR